MGQGAFRGRDVDQFQKLNASAFEQGVADSSLVKKLFKDIDEGTQTIHVLFRPYMFTYRMERGTRRNGGPPDVITPLLCFANLSPSGK